MDLNTSHWTTSCEEHTIALLGQDAQERTNQ
jgi:hypothetical protein